MEIRQLKQQQIEEETETLDELVRSKLDVTMQEIMLLSRTTALKVEEATGVIVGAFNGFVAALALDTETSREEFLKELGEAYDEAVSAESKDVLDDDLEELNEALLPPVS